MRNLKFHSFRYILGYSMLHISVFAISFQTRWLNIFNPLWLWYGIWLSLLVVFIVILHTSENKKIYLLYFIFGSLFGFYFDIISFTFGYYSYPDFFMFKIFGLPLTMIFAEGFSITITMKVFEIVKKSFTRGFRALGRTKF